jgi:hypothetical protein
MSLYARDPIGETSAEVLINPIAELESGGPCGHREVFPLGGTALGDGKNLSRDQPDTGDRNRPYPSHLTKLRPRGSVILQIRLIIRVYKCLPIQLVSRLRSPPNPCHFRPIAPPRHRGSDPPRLRITATPIRCADASSWLRSAAPTLSHSTPVVALIHHTSTLPRLQSTAPPHCHRSNLTRRCSAIPHPLWL